MSTVADEAKRLNRKRWSWYLYDFGNSAYAAVVLLAVYSAYFKGQVVGGKEGTRLWGLSVGIAMLVVALISPVLGAVADHSNSKKRFLLASTSVAVVFTALLFFVTPGKIAIGMLFFILAEVGYRAGQVFYDSLLPEIADEGDMGRVSGLGWAIGSAGGVLCLLIILPLIMIFKGAMMVRLAFVITAVYYALSTLPLIFMLKEQGTATPLPAGENYLTLGLGRLLKTMRAIRSHTEFVKFLVSFLIYNNGVMIAMNFASIIGAVLFGMNQTELIIFVIVVQLTNVAVAFLLGHLVDRLGGKRALAISIGLMVVAVLLMFVATSKLFFFGIGALAGFAMAGIQSVSRTMGGILAPPDQSAEFYGFYSVAAQASSFIGPTLYGALAYRAARWYQNVHGLGELAAEQAGQRVAILSMAVFLLAGVVVLTSVNENRARQALRLALKARKAAQPASGSGV